MQAIDFSDVWHVLESGTPPEITHYRQGSHPGINWRLKTVVGSRLDANELLVVWTLIAAQHPNLVTLCDAAFDWFETAIPDAVSVWTHQTVDIQPTLEDGLWDFVIVPWEESFNQMGKMLSRALKSKKTKQNLDPSHWHNLHVVAQSMCSWTTDQQAQARRKGFKVSHNEADSGQGDNTHKLDTE